VRRDVALREDDRSVGVDPGREEPGCDVERPFAQSGRIVLERDRVEVDDAEDGVAALLVSRYWRKPPL